jgi:TetR/AcrR family transcriptional regulator, regulator of cefoperazone and chloramphenicol sensitivity
MQPPHGDRTARAVIRDEAMRLFAGSGVHGVTLRQIADAAGVTHGLVVHHFGSKEGLREAVDTFVVDLFDELVEGAVEGPAGAELYDPEAVPSLVELMMGALPPDSPVPDYLRRLLLEGGPTGTELFQRLFALSRRLLDELVQAGLATPGNDPDVRAALLMANDLAVFLLRPQLTAVLGDDPLTAAGMSRWAAELMSVYGGGLRG